jgi:hypothetical protein
MLQNLGIAETYLQLYYACNQHSVSHTWVSLGSTGRSTGVRRRQEDMVESVTWNKETNRLLVGTCFGYKSAMAYYQK